MENNGVDEPRTRESGTDPFVTAIERLRPQ